MTSDFPAGPLTRPTRKADRVSYDRATVHAVLDEAIVCHVGFVVDGRPVVLPQLDARVGEMLYLHGSTGARALRTARDGGLGVCVTVTLLLQRHPQHGGRGELLAIGSPRSGRPAGNDRLDQGLESSGLLVGVLDHRRGAVHDDRSVVGRVVERGSGQHEPVQVSAKVRSGPPVDDADDLDSPYWAGVLPLSVVAGQPLPAPDLAEGIEVPDHVRSWRRPRSADD